VLALAKADGIFSNDCWKRKDPSPTEETPGIIGMNCTNQLKWSLCNWNYTLSARRRFLVSGLGFFNYYQRSWWSADLTGLPMPFKRFFSGIILVGDTADDATIRALRSTDYPLLLLEKISGTGKLNSVNSDMVAGAQLVANHTKKFGYKKHYYCHRYHYHNQIRSCFIDEMKCIEHHHPRSQ